MRPGWNHLQSTPPFLADRPKSLRTCPKQPQKLLNYDRTRITALVTPVGLEPTTRWLKASYAHPVAPRGQTHSSQPRSGPANYLRLCFINSIISVVRGRVELPILSAARFELAVYAIPPPDHARLSGPPSQLCKKNPIYALHLTASVGSEGIEPSLLAESAPWTDVYTIFTTNPGAGLSRLPVD